MEKCSQHNGNVCQACVNIWFVSSIPGAVTVQGKKNSQHALLASDACSDATGHGGRTRGQEAWKHDGLFHEGTNKIQAQACSQKCPSTYCYQLATVPPPIFLRSKATFKFSRDEEESPCLEQGRGHRSRVRFMNPTTHHAQQKTVKIYDWVCAAPTQLKTTLTVHVHALDFKIIFC